MLGCAGLTEAAQIAGSAGFVEPVEPAFVEFACFELVFAGPALLAIAESV